jgi:hypothetical protein
MPASPSTMRETVTLSRRVAVSPPPVRGPRSSTIRACRFVVALLIAAALGWPAAAREPGPAAHDVPVPRHDHGWPIEVGNPPRFGFAGGAGAAGDDPLYEPVALAPELEASFTAKKYKRDPKSGNYLAPKVFA